MSSRKLRVQVLDGNKQVVAVKLPAVAVDWMETLMPPHVLTRIKEQNIDLGVIKERAKASGMAPQELFQTQSGTRTYRVSLE